MLIAGWRQRTRRSKATNFGFFYKLFMPGKTFFLFVRSIAELSREPMRFSEPVFSGLSIVYDTMI